MRKKTPITQTGGVYLYAGLFDSPIWKRCLPACPHQLEALVGLWFAGRVPQLRFPCSGPEHFDIQWKPDTRMVHQLVPRSPQRQWGIGSRESIVGILPGSSHPLLAVDPPVGRASAMHSLAGRGRLTWTDGFVEETLKASPK